jgi:hypothetical protein
MKSTLRFSLLALLLLAVCAAPPAGANGAGPSAGGDFRFAMDDGVTRYIEFNARTHKDGTSSGEMTFSAQGELPDQDVDGEELPELPAGVFMRARFDCLTVSRNRAAMSGAVTESNVPGYVGRAVLLVVEDGGEGAKAPARDRLTWGVYLKPDTSRVPTDAERPDEWQPDSWEVSDFERADDKPVRFEFNKEQPVGCHSFPDSAYTFVEVARGDGNIQVRP